MRKCVICGAIVINRNPKTQTCSPECTAKRWGKKPPEMHYNQCEVCGIAIPTRDRYCDACALDLLTTNRGD
jgi:predicted nucleic acid-binding Zn ribbon protein